jgi:hypothetical protein
MQLVCMHAVRRLSYLECFTYVEDPRFLPLSVVDNLSQIGLWRSCAKLVSAFYLISHDPLDLLNDSRVW